MGNDQVQVFVTLAYLLGMAACDGFLVQGVEDRNAGAFRNTAQAGDVVQLIDHDRVGDVSLHAGSLGDLLGDLTTIPKEEPKPEPKPEPKKEQPAPKKEEPKPEPPKETPKKGDPMKLPDKDDKSMDFLDGCWNCRTGLSDTRGNPIKVRFCFGKNGKGQITIIDRQGKTYTGRADAQMQNGRLHIDTGDATSRNSRGSFNGLRIDCSPGAGNDAMCYGRNKGDNSPWSAKFFRD